MNFQEVFSLEAAAAVAAIKIYFRIVQVFL